MRTVMTTTAQLLEKVAPEIEKELKPRLKGLIGSFVRAYLPQVWVFETEKDSATVRVETSGSVTVSPTSAPSPDVSIHAPKALLQKILTSRTRPETVPEDVRIVPHTTKGRVAFDQVRARFGL
jgi:hypothetical protein